MPGMAFRTGLGFGAGTSEDCKRLVQQLFQPEALFSAYRTARDAYRTNDIVLVASDRHPDVLGGTRWAYARHLHQIFGKRATEFRMVSESAHEVMSLPRDSDAMWLVIDLQGADLPVMCVIYAIPYEAAASAN